MIKLVIMLLVASVNARHDQLSKDQPAEEKMIESMAFEMREEEASSVNTQYNLKAGATCEDGFEPIWAETNPKWGATWTETANECEEAAKALGFTGDQVAHVGYRYDWKTDRPQGCFQSWSMGRFHFNRGNGGNFETDPNDNGNTDKILCKAVAADASADDSSYTLVNDKECDVLEAATNLDLTEAKAKCNEMENCGFVLGHSCGDFGYSFCSTGAELKDANGECVYQKN